MNEAAGETPRSTTFCPAESRRYVLIAAILASSMGFIDGSVMSIATPALRADLGASLSEAQWVTNSYMLFLASLLLLGGAVGDRFGLRNVFAGGIVLFVAASLVSAVAPNPGLLIAARAVQGIGAAFMVPGSLAIIAKAYPREERGRAIGIWASASSLTTILGPVIGGFVITALGEGSWRLVFAINLPLGLIALFLLFWRVPADPPAERRRLDIVGGALVTIGLLLVALGLTGEAGDGGLDVGGMVVRLGIGALFLLGFLVWEARTDAPMLPLGLFRSAAFSGAQGLTFALYFALAGITFYLPMVMIAGWGVSEAETALVSLPLGIALTLLSSFAGRLSDRYGPGPLIAFGSVLVAIAFGAMGLVAPFHNVWFGIFPLMVLMGIGMGFVVSPLSTAVMTSVEDADTGLASGVNNAVARVAGLLAIASMGALAGAVFSAQAGAAGLSFGLIPDMALSPEIEAQRVAANDAGFAAVAVVTAVLSVVSAVVAWFTQERKRPAG